MASRATSHRAGPKSGCARRYPFLPAPPTESPYLLAHRDVSLHRMCSRAPIRGQHYLAKALVTTLFQAGLISIRKSSETVWPEPPSTACFDNFREGLGDDFVTAALVDACTLGDVVHEIAISVPSSRSSIRDCIAPFASIPALSQRNCACFSPFPLPHGRRPIVCRNLSASSLGRKTNTVGLSTPACRASSRTDPSAADHSS